VTSATLDFADVEFHPRVEWELPVETVESCTGSVRAR
jgi:hypothetical protein